jgi:membrane-associated protease RseP (regulator of RpoE activity)
MENNERFPLVINGKRIETIEELRNNFNFKYLLRYYKSGELKKWLEDRGYNEEARKINELHGKDPTIKEMCEILGVPFCDDNKSFGKSLKQDEMTIIIEGPLVDPIIRIKTVGRVAWGLCAAALAVAITMILALPAEQVAGPVGDAAFVAGEAVAGTAAFSILGTAAVPAIIIGVAAGGVGALSKLRDKYDIVEKTDGYTMLKRKK